MGISIETYRLRIGRFHHRGGSKSALSSNGGYPYTGFGLKLFPVGVIVLLLLIAGVEPNPGPDQVCKYCHSTFSNILQFCEHAKIHQSSKNFTILCGFPKCSVRLANVNSYRTHWSKSHVARVVPKSVPVVTSLSCPVATCTTRITSREFYSKHMVHEHLKKGQTFQCIFEGCTTVSSYIKQFRTHLSRYHYARDIVDVDIADDANDHGDETGDGDDNYENDEENNILPDEGPYSCNAEEDIDLYPDCLIKEELARFYLKMESVFILASSTVQSVAEEIKVLSELSHYRLKKGLYKELKKTNLEEDVIRSVVRQAFKEDTVFNVHHKHEDAEQLGTHYSRLKFWKNNFPFVEPQEINLFPSGTGKSRKAHYVSIRQSLNMLLKDPKVKAAVLKSFDYKPENPNILSDYMDGSAYQEHRELHEGPCLQLFLFQDAFDFNAFGPSTGVYKPVGFYFSLGNIPAVYRSKVDLIHLVYMILENDFKPTEEEEIKDFDKTKEALKPLLDELKDLKLNGIDIDGKKVPVCLLFLLGDSLGQNTIGGYVKNFSSAEFSCRFCPISKTDFKSKPYETKPLRTVQEYDSYSIIAKRKWSKLRKDGLKAQKKAKERAKQLRLHRIANRSSAISKRNLKGLMNKTAFKRMCAVSYRGVKYRPSALNSADINFHVVGAQPPCIAHDLHEGIVRVIVAKVLKYLIETKGWFDLPCLNSRIDKFQCKGLDARDKPAKLKCYTKLSGNACQNWNMLRLLPIIISDLIQDPCDPMWQLFLQLKQICEYVSAPRITLTQVSYLQFIIESYLSKVKELLPSCLTPKSHYLCHYPDLILMFGPLIRLFTLRFESKHSFFKNVVRACKNYINITYTMANKYTYRFAYDHGSSDLLPLDLVYNTNFSVGVNPDLLTDREKKVFPQDFDWADAEELRSASIHGIDYNKGFYFVLESDGNNLRVGCIERIFLQRCSGTVQFLIQEKFAENSFNGYYIINKSSIGLKLTTISELPDYYALPAYDVGGYEYLSLKHTTITME